MHKGGAVGEHCQRRESEKVTDNFGLQEIQFVVAKTV